MNKQEIDRCRNAFVSKYGERPQEERWAQYGAWWDFHYEIWSLSWEACLNANPKQTDSA